MPWRAWMRVVCISLMTACAHAELKIGAAPVDAIIVPGCPTTSDGKLSDCLKRRVLWAAHLWELGLTRHVITSGAATHNPFVEAEAIAAGLVACGVPADRIWLERQARHTDENMYYALDIVDAQGWTTFAIASDGVHASSGCSFMASWKRECMVSGLDRSWVQANADNAQYAVLEEVKIKPVADDGWLPMKEYERQRVENGGRSRPGSISLYLSAPFRRLFGSPWIPVPASGEAPPLLYSELLEEHGTPSAD